MPLCLVDAAKNVADLVFRMPHELHAGVKSPVRSHGQLLFPQFAPLGAVGAFVDVGGNFHFKGRKIELFLPEGQIFVPFGKEPILPLQLPEVLLLPIALRALVGISPVR